MSVPPQFNSHLDEVKTQELSPAELCRMYHTGTILRGQLVAALISYPYKPMGEPKDDFDDLIFHPPGSWAEVDTALRLGHLTDDIYDEVADSREELDNKGQET